MIQKLGFSLVLVAVISFGIWGFAADPASARPDPTESCPYLNICQNPINQAGYYCSASNGQATCLIGKETGTNEPCYEHCWWN